MQQGISTGQGTVLNVIKLSVNARTYVKSLMLQQYLPLKGKVAWPVPRKGRDG